MKLAGFATSNKVKNPLPYNILELLCLGVMQQRLNAGLPNQGCEAAFQGVRDAFSVFCSVLRVLSS